MMQSDELKNIRSHSSFNFLFSLSLSLSHVPFELFLKTGQGHREVLSSLETHTCHDTHSQIRGVFMMYSFFLLGPSLVLCEMSYPVVCSLILHSLSLSLSPSLSPSLCLSLCLSLS